MQPSRRRELPPCKGSNISSRLIKVSWKQNCQASCCTAVRPKNCRAWNKAWTPILDVYLETLALTNELDEAIDKAFAGVNWDEMEKAWIDYTLAI